MTVMHDPDIGTTIFGVLTAADEYRCSTCGSLTCDCDYEWERHFAAVAASQGPWWRRLIRRHQRV